MKIGFIEPGLHVCGGIRRIIETSNRLINLGHDVTLFTPRGISCNWLPNKANVLKLANLSSYKFDVVIFNLANQYKHALHANAKKRVFWVLAPEALYKTPDVPVKALQQDFYLIANSKFTVQYIKKYCKRKINHRIPIVPGGINPEHFKYDKNQPTNFHVMYYGSPRPWKGARIIEAAVRGMPWKVLKMQGLNTPQNQLYKLYNSSEVYVSAGQSEGFNFNILESFACGCPVICTDDGGSRDFVKDGVNALVTRRDPLSIRNAINKVLADRPLQRRLRNEGLKTAVKSRYDWDVITAQFEAYLTKE